MENLINIVINTKLDKNHKNVPLGIISIRKYDNN